MSNDLIGEALQEGLTSVMSRQHRRIGEIENEVADALGYSTSMVHKWRKGKNPPNLQVIDFLVRYCVKNGHVDYRWAVTILSRARHPNPDSLLNELLPYFSEPELYSFQREVEVERKSKRAKNEIKPFVAGPPITDPRQFFGRESHLKNLFRLWQDYPFQHAAIVGLKRSGKTSLLHYLRRITTADPSHLRPGQKVDWLVNPGRYRWVFINFQDPRMCKLENLLSYILESLHLKVPHPCSLYSFLDVIESLRDPSIILMDEIAVALGSNELDTSFWNSLRSLVSGSLLLDDNLGFVITAPESPGRLAKNEGKESPFFNIFSTMELTAFSDDEARQLIASSPIPFSAADIEWILVESGRWPCLLQFLCQARLVALLDGVTDESWKEEGLRQLGQFRYFLAK